MCDVLLHQIGFSLHNVVTSFFQQKVFGYDGSFRLIFILKAHITFTVVFLSVHFDIVEVYI